MLKYYNKYYYLYGGELVGYGITSIVLTDPLPPVVPDYSSTIKNDNLFYLESVVRGPIIKSNYVAKCVSESVFDKEIKLFNELNKKIEETITEPIQFKSHFVFPVDTVKRQINFEELNKNVEIYTTQWRGSKDISRYNYVLVFPRGVSRRDFVLRNSITELLKFVKTLQILKLNKMYVPDMKLDNVVLIDNTFKIIDFLLMCRYTEIHSAYKSSITVHAIYYLSYSIEYQLLFRYMFNNIRSKVELERNLNKELRDITRIYNLYKKTTEQDEKNRIIQQDSYVSYLPSINMFFTIFYNLLKNNKSSTKLKLNQVTKLNENFIEREIELDIDYSDNVKMNKLLFYCFPFYTMLFIGYNDSMSTELCKIMTKLYICRYQITPEQLQLYSFGIMILNFLYYKERRKLDLEKQIAQLDINLKSTISVKEQESLTRSKEILSTPLEEINNFFTNLNKKLLIDVLLLCFIHYYNGEVILPKTDLVQEKINELLS